MSEERTILEYFVFNPDGTLAFTTNSLGGHHENIAARSLIAIAADFNVDIDYKYTLEDDVIIKARSNIRFEKGMCNQFNDNLVNNIQPILERDPSAWNHFQRPNGDDRTNTKWEQWPSCTNDIQVVFAPSFTFPIWNYQAPFLDTIFAMENKFAKEHILHPNFLLNIMKTFIDFATNSDSLAMEADKVWFKYLMDNRVAIFGFPMASWMTREQKIII